MKSKFTYQSIEEKYKKISPLLNERARRMWVALEAQSVGYGGQRIVYKATGVSINTIRKGIQELESGADVAIKELYIRNKGGGRKSQASKDQSLKYDIMNIVESSTRGDPEAPLLWCSKSLRKIADEINKKSHRASHTYISKILSEEGYSLQSNRKVHEGSNHVDRDAQFNFILSKTKDFQNRNQPVISVDAKKKELIGFYKNAGMEYSKKGNPTKVRVYDFIDKEKGKAAPYGVYDVSKNNGFVNVGISADTAEFAVNSIRHWWQKMGEGSYKGSSEIYINADGGGSNGSRLRLWKIELQKFANEIKKTIHVSHFPPGTSKWNKIEHKMFCFISKNWRGKPLIDRATIVQLIANTTTKKGLTIQSTLDERIYKKGIKVSNKELRNICIVADKFHGEWNYKISPK